MWTPLLIPLLLADRVLSATRYAEYILAPESRTIYPASIRRTNGTVSNAQSLVAGTNGSATLAGNSSITFDYGKNIGGVVSVTVGSAPSDAVLAITFTESSLWINGQASDATADAGLDSPLWLPVGGGPGTYSVAREFDRGAFRYLSLVSNSSAAVEVESVAVNFTAAPTQDLRGYSGYFHSNDELLNRIWYAGKCPRAGRDTRKTHDEFPTFVPLTTIPSQGYTQLNCARLIPSMETR